MALLFLNLLIGFIAIAVCLLIQALLLKLNLGTGLDGGGMIRFLSAFPAEQEVLFPPLTYLERVGQTDEVKLKRGRRVKIVEVKPTLA